MITTSEKWKEYTAQHHIFHIKGVLTSTDEVSLNLTDEDFMMGTVRITDSTSDSDVFTVGAVVTNTFEGTLNNTQGKFESFNFDNATLSVQIGIVYEDETEEWIDRGIYTVDRPSSLGYTIKITCYDYADKLNKYYIGKIKSNNVISDVQFPINSSAFVEGLCTYCGVPYEGWNLPNDLSVSAFEFDESTTCRQVIGWILQINGGFGKMTPQGEFTCAWYDTSGDWGDSDDIDGGTMWATVPTVDGGTMWVAVADYNGGNIAEIKSWEINQVAQTTVGMDDISITGVRAYAYGTVDEFEFETVGRGGYVLALSDNPLITSDNMLEVATAVYEQCSGIMFRIFDASAWLSPDVEAKDFCIIQDYRGQQYQSLITNLTYNVNGLCDISCGAETPGENSLETANPTTQTIGGAITAAYDYILAKKISADYITAGNLGVNGTITASDLEITGGKAGNFTIQDGKIKSTYTVPHTYTNDDLVEMNNIISQGTTPTQEQLELYDLDQDGEITLDDTDIVNTIIMQYGGVLSSTVTLDPSNYAKMVTTENNLGNLSYLGGWGGVFDQLKWNGNLVDAVITDVINYNYGGFAIYGFTLSNGTFFGEGLVDLGNVAINSAYGNLYFTSKTINFPINLGNIVRHFSTTTLASIGLVSSHCYVVDTTSFSVYLSDSRSETVRIYLQFSIVTSP